jgi:LPXTG-motif cell wall-anchored protein
VYLSADWERDIFNISQAVFNSPPLPQEIVPIEPKNRTDNLVPRPGQPVSSSKKLSTGAIAGIAIGAIAVILLLAGLGWWLYRRKQNAEREAEVSQTLPDDAKKNAELGEDGVAKPPVGPRTDFELDGRMVEEMYAPQGDHELHGNKPSEQVTELVEADAASPIYELASPPHELPAPDEHTQKPHV